MLKVKQRGMSLIEIMVAIVIGSILTLGVVQMFISNKHSYRLQESSNFLQENGRFALQVIDYSIRMADHWGGVNRQLDGDPIITAVSTPADATGCTGAWMATTDEGIRGYEGTTGTSSPLPLCIADADYVDSSDVLVVRYASPDSPVANGDLAANANKMFVFTDIDSDGVLFKGSDGAQGAANDGAYNYLYQVEVYFLRPCSVSAGTTCASTDDDGDPLPTLTKLSLNDNVLTEYPLIEGIEQLQFEYGVDQNDDNSVDFYTAAAGVTDWNEVSAIRFSVVSRSNTIDISYTDSATYSLAGGYTHDPASSVENKRRRQFTHVVQLRNRSRS